MLPWLPYNVQYILVKAPLRVLYEKIQHEGWGRVANTARGKHEYMVLLLICWFCVGGLLVFSMVRNSQYESFRQGRVVMMHAFKVYSRYLTQS